MENYIKYLCNGCKNKDTDLCNITKTVDNKLKCVFYEREVKEKKKAVSCFVTAKQHEPVMRRII